MRPSPDPCFGKTSFPAQPLPSFQQCQTHHSSQGLGIAKPGLTIPHTICTFYSCSFHTQLLVQVEPHSVHACTYADARCSMLLPPCLLLSTERCCPSVQVSMATLCGLPSQVLGPLTCSLISGITKSGSSWSPSNILWPHYLFYSYELSINLPSIKLGVKMLAVIELNVQTLYLCLETRPHFTM